MYIGKLMCTGKWLHHFHAPWSTSEHQTVTVCRFARKSYIMYMWKVACFCLCDILLLLLFLPPVSAVEVTESVPSVCLDLWELRCALPQWYRTMLCTTTCINIVHHQPMSFSTLTAKAFDIRMRNLVCVYQSWEKDFGAKGKYSPDCGRCVNAGAFLWR